MSIYLLFYVTFNSQGHIATGSLQVEETSAYCTVNQWASASNYQLSNMKRPARDSKRRPQRLEARTLTATPPSPLFTRSRLGVKSFGKDFKSKSISFEIFQIPIKSKILCFSKGFKSKSFLKNKILFKFIYKFYYILQKHINYYIYVSRILKLSFQKTNRN